MEKTDSKSNGVNRRRLLKAGVAGLAAGLLLKLVDSDELMIKKVSAADGQAIIIGQGNSGSSTTTLSSPVNGGPTAFIDNNGGTGDAQAIQGRITGTSGRAFVGYASGTSGSTIALDGVCDSPSGIALRGANTATSGNAIGIQGQTSCSTGVCIIGKGPGAAEVFRVQGSMQIIPFILDTLVETCAVIPNHHVYQADALQIAAYKTTGSRLFLTTDRDCSRLPGQRNWRSLT